MTDLRTQINYDLFLSIYEKMNQFLKQLLTHINKTDDQIKALITLYGKKNNISFTCQKV